MGVGGLVVGWCVGVDGLVVGWRVDLGGCRWADDGLVGR